MLEVVVESKRVRGSDRLPYETPPDDVSHGIAGPRGFALAGLANPPNRACCLEFPMPHGGSRHRDMFAEFETMVQALGGGMVACILRITIDPARQDGQMCLSFCKLYRGQVDRRLTCDLALLWDGSINAPD